MKTYIWIQIDRYAFKGVFQKHNKIGIQNSHRESANLNWSTNIFRLTSWAICYHLLIYLLSLCFVMDALCGTQTPRCHVYFNLKTDGSIYIPICKPAKLWRLISTESNVATSSSSSSSSSSSPLYINTSSTKTNQNPHIPTTSKPSPSPSLDENVCPNRPCRPG